MLPNEILDILPRGAKPIAVEPISGSGSNRRYWRVLLSSGERLIATFGTNLAENRAFIYLAEKLSEAGVRVPKVLSVSSSGLAYTQTDVGDQSLFELLTQKDLIERTIVLMVNVHSVRNIDYSRCYPVAEMDKRSVMWDLNYFKYCFLKTCPDIEFDENALEDDFETLADRLLAANNWAFMVRDFQSRNVLISKDNDPYLIDFQGGRRGPVYYDLASFLWQARAGFSDDLREEMVSLYCRLSSFDSLDFRRELQYFVVFRLLQVLGAYGFRGRFEHKDHFIRSIAPAVESIRKELPKLNDLPCLTSLLPSLR